MFSHKSFSIILGICFWEFFQTLKSQNLIHMGKSFFTQHYFQPKKNCAKCEQLSIDITKRLLIVFTTTTFPRPVIKIFWRILFRFFIFNTTAVFFPFVFSFDSPKTLSLTCTSSFCRYLVMKFF